MAKIILKDKKKNALLSVAETGLLMVAEAGFIFLDNFFPKKYPETRLSRQLFGLDSVSRKNWRTSLDRLVRRGLVRKEKSKSGLKYTITIKGKSWFDGFNKEFEKEELWWDGKWRIVSFDIPEKLRKHRDALRSELAANGYQKLQNSVWVGRLPLSADVFEFIQEERLDDYVHLFLANNFDKEDDIKKLFIESRSF